MKRKTFVALIAAVSSGAKLAATPIARLAAELPARRARRIAAGSAGCASARGRGRFRGYVRSDLA